MFLCPLPTVSTPATPLLEEERYISLFALALNIDHPFLLHGARLWAGFSADNNPIDSPQVDLSEIFEQWFYRQEPDLRCDFTECIDPR